MVVVVYFSGYGGSRWGWGVFFRLLTYLALLLSNFLVVVDHRQRALCPRQKGEKKKKKADGLVPPDPPR